MASERNKYIDEYIKDHYKRINLNFKAEKYDELKYFADREQSSVSAFIKRAIENEFTKIRTRPEKSGNVPEVELNTLLLKKVRMFLEVGYIEGMTASEYINKVLSDDLSRIGKEKGRIRI